MPLGEHSLALEARARFAVGTAVAVAIASASLALPTPLSAQSSPAGAGGATVPGGPPGTPGPTEPAQPTPAQPPVAQPPPAQPTPCASKRLHLRCPDLIMSAPFRLHLDRTTMPGHVLLRAASSIDNLGSGPLELRAHRVPSHGMVVYQAIYGRRGHAHLWRTAAALVYKYVPGERYGRPTIGAFSYWKLHHAAAFQLWSIDAGRRAIALVRTGPKVDYCLRDLTRSHPSRRSPRAPVYPACSQDPHVNRDVLGTSVGWSDVYPYEYPQQWIDVTGLHGRFAYVQVADPDGALIESNHQNDVSETYVSLPSGRVLGHRVGVAAP